MFWGGRTDHSLANLFCLAKQTANIPISMPGPNQNGYLLKNQQSLELIQDIGQLVSIMAMLKDCYGVSNTGMKYPINNSTINVGSGLGISNESIATSCDVSLNQGVLLVLTDSRSKAQIINSHGE